MIRALVAIAALIVGALGVIDLFKSEPQPKVAAETVVEKNEEHVAVWMTTAPAVPANR